MIRGIFLSRFDPEKGPIVVHQVPRGSITPSSESPEQRQFFDFSSVSDFLITRQEFCDRLVTICANKHRIIGHPMCITDPDKYERNEFIFNLALVLDEEVDPRSYQSVVRKLARLFRTIEEQSGLLSVGTHHLSGSNTKSVESSESNTIYSLCEMILEDLNNYCECMIPLDQSDTLNVKLFPAYPPPPSVKGSHVPLSPVRLTTLVDGNSDLTLSRIIPYINGVNSVVKIAQLADTDLKLTRRALSHLLYYVCLLLLDLFQYSSIYAPTAEISDLVLDTSMQAECARYCATWHQRANNFTIVQLFLSLRPGQTLKQWVIENTALLEGIDVRRFITFGIIKGIIYRVHRYAISTKVMQPRPSGLGHAHALRHLTHRVGRDGNITTSSPLHNSGSADLSALRQLPLNRYLDGQNSLDDMCSELEIPEKTMLSKLKTRKDVQIIHR